MIGLFGLAGLAGALVAPLLGRLADRGRDRLSLLVVLVATLASWALLALGSSSLAALIAGIVVFDAGVQRSHINDQNAIYRLDADVRSRLTTAYMVAFFAGGVAGSVLATRSKPLPAGARPACSVPRSRSSPCSQAGAGARPASQDEPAGAQDLARAG